MPESPDTDPSAPNAPSGDPVQPYIPASTSLPEITFKAVVLGVLLSVLLAGANAYLGLKAGMTVSASIPAAVISMAVLRMFRRSNILENNIVQTAASAGESLAAGVIFTLPALLILKHWTEFNYWETTIIAALGGVIGVMFTIPLRRALIVRSPLKFPEGVATAEVLKVGDQGGGGVQHILVGGLVGAVFKLGDTGLRLWKGVVEGGAQIGGSIGYVGTNTAPALLAVGYIVGINIAVLVFAGGAINWYAAIPIVAGSMEWPTHQITERITEEDAAKWHTFAVSVPAAASWSEAEFKPVQDIIADARAAGDSDEDIVNELAGSVITDWPTDRTDKGTARLIKQLAAVEHHGAQIGADEWANRIWSKQTRYLGVGAMVIGGLWALLRMSKSLVMGIASSVQSYRSNRNGETEAIPRTERDTPMKLVGIGLVLSVIPLFFVFEHVTDSVPIAAVMAVVMLIAAFLFSAVASYMAGLVGSSNNPISGMTIATLLTAALLLLALKMDGSAGPAAAIFIGGVVACAAAIGGDNMQDLKAGHLLGATPYKQQIMQMVGVLAAAVVMAPVLTALAQAYGIGPEAIGLGPEGSPGQSLEAPQASLMASVASGVFKGGLPWGLVYVGMIIAVGVIAIDVFLESRNSSFRAPVLAVAVGIYLPLELSTPIFIGGLVSFAAHRFHMRRVAGEASGELRSSLMEAKSSSERNGLLMAAGLITGEAMLGILLAIPLAAWAGENRIAGWFHGITGLEDLWWPGLVLLGAVIALLYRVAAGPSK